MSLLLELAVGVARASTATWSDSGGPPVYVQTASSRRQTSHGKVPEHLTFRFRQKAHAWLVRGYLSLRFFGRGSGDNAESAMIAVDGKEWKQKFGQHSRNCYEDEVGRRDDVRKK